MLLQNKLVYDFNLQAASQVARICQPLFEHTPIKSFSYIKFYKDGSIYHLSTDKLWIQRYFEFSLYENQDAVQEGMELKLDDGLYTNIWITPPSSILYKALYDLGTWNCCTICNIEGDYIEGFGFGADRNHFEILNFYLRHQNLLKRFVFYFKERSHYLIKIQNKDNLILSNSKPFVLTSQIDKDKENMNQFIQKTALKRYYIGETDLYLTKREKECLDYLLTGQSSKSIAINLDISTRTVESYINSLKSKFGSTTKLAMINKMSNFPWALQKG